MRVGTGAEGFVPGQRVGVPWLGHTCGTCFYCRSGMENLCDSPGYTGFTRDGGFASHIVADARFCFAIPEVFGDVEAAPLMCAGLIGHRAYTMAGEARRLGLYGFGAAAHILAQIAGASGEEPPAELDAAIISVAPRSQGRQGDLRRNPHERDPGVPL